MHKLTVQAKEFAATGYSLRSHLLMLPLAGALLIVPDTASSGPLYVADPHFVSGAAPIQSVHYCRRNWRTHRTMHQYYPSYSFSGGRYGYSNPGAYRYSGYYPYSGYGYGQLGVSDGLIGLGFLGL